MYFFSPFWKAAFKFTIFDFPSELDQEKAARTPDNCCNLLLDSTCLQKQIFSAHKVNIFSNKVCRVFENRRGCSWCCVGYPYTTLILFLFYNWKNKILFTLHCAVPENIHTPPTEGVGISWGVGGSVRPKNLKKFTCMRLNCNFRGGGRHIF